MTAPELPPDLAAEFDALPPELGRYVAGRRAREGDAWLAPWLKCRRAAVAARVERDLAALATRSEPSPAAVEFLARRGYRRGAKWAAASSYQLAAAAPGVAAPRDTGAAAGSEGGPPVHADNESRRPPPPSTHCTER